MSITSNRLTAEQYKQNFSDIHPPFDTKEAALVEAKMRATSASRVEAGPSEFGVRKAECGVAFLGVKSGFLGGNKWLFQNFGNAECRFKIENHPVTHKTRATSRLA